MRQTLNPSEYEIIIVDDGSKDNSLLIAQNIISQNKTHDIKLIKKPNGGTASARNAGMVNSSGKYIGFLDADDEYAPQKAELSIKYLEFGSEVGLVYSDYIEVNEQKMFYTAKRDFDPSTLKQHCIVSTNSFIKRDIINTVGYFNEAIKIIEDYDYWMRISAANYMCLRIPMPLFTYYLHGQNKTVVSRSEDINKEHAMLRR
jgi:glycosyltransferase involved in cell wall biosynthesis